ncbi:hypothetical protein [Pseudomonas aylmerensis]|uniref:hypothetical protein n=1 Tax=Pseudomonas aylmerensis TaxID=1869229 RepID=UPI00114CBF5E|nr:hypothetical protein [Pseudomonas aylmerensis]
MEQTQGELRGEDEEEGEFTCKWRDSFTLRMLNGERQAGSPWKPLTQGRDGAWPQTLFVSFVGAGRQLLLRICACFNLESSDERSPHLLNMTVDSLFSAALTVCACLEQDNIQLHYPKDNGEGLVRERGEDLIIRAVTESEG